MTSKQLANVLIKILGLSVCIHAIPLLISGFIVGGLGILMSGGAESNELLRLLSSPIGAAIQAGVGVFMIVKSQIIAGWLFKTDNE